MHQALVKVEGYRQSQVDFARREATVLYDAGLSSPTELAATLRRETGYTVSVNGPHSRSSEGMTP